MKKINSIIALTTVTALAVASLVGANAAVTEPVAVNATAEEAVEQILADGMSTSNITLAEGAESQLATFEAPADMGLPFNSGIVLTTGKASSLFSSELASDSLSINGDSDLTAIYQSDGFYGQTNDAVKLSFDLTPEESALSFDFFFASSEYDQNKQYNDTFALWLIDSETGEKFNVALTPFGKTVNVQNTVTKDDDENMLFTEASKYYIPVLGCTYNNYSFGMLGMSTQFTADGTSLKNSLGHNVIESGKTVTIQFAIADSSDSIRDSAIFIRSNSLASVKSDVNTNTVTFNANGGSCDVETTKTGTDGTLESLPNAAMDNLHTFDGWYTKTSGGEKISVNTKFSQDTTVYAHWLSNEYTITFDTDGGNKLENLVYTSESTDVIPAAVKDGFTFTGWSVVSGDGNWDIDKVVEPNTSVNGKNGNLSLKANWEKIQESTVVTTIPAPTIPSATSKISTADTATKDTAVNSNGTVATGAVVPMSIAFVIILIAAAGTFYTFKKKNR